MVLREVRVVRVVCPVTTRVDIRLPGQLKSVCALKYRQCLVLQRGK